MTKPESLQETKHVVGLRMDTFLYFVVSLQSRFYTFVLFFVFNVYIYSSSLRLFMIDPVVSLLPATHRQYFIIIIIISFYIAHLP
jgi:hypothetical protein